MMSAENATSAAGAASPGRRSGKVNLEVYDPEHFDGVIRLYERVFGAKWAGHFQRRWHWSQEANLLSGQTRRWVLLHDRRVVGFLATIPLPYVISGMHTVAHTPCDFMVDPEFRFHGVRLMREFFRTCENCVTCDDIPDTMELTRWLGAQAVGRTYRYVRLLDARALRGRPEPLLNGMARFPWPLNGALRVTDALRGAKGEGDARVTPVTIFDERVNDYFSRVAQTHKASLVRDKAFLDWRYGEGSPHEDRQIGIAEDAAGGIAGYVVFRMTSRPDRAGQVLDAQTAERGDQRTLYSLIDHACSQLRRQGAWLVRCHLFGGLDEPPSPVLQQLGFRRRGGHTFMVRFTEPSLHNIAVSPSGWSYAYGDSEASHADV